jgi:hypothetical protein
MSNKLFILLALASCTENRGAIEGTQSLEVELVTPASGGTVMNRLLDSQRTITVNLRAKDAEGALDTTFNEEVRVYAQYLGTLTPGIDKAPLVSVTMTNGVAMNVTVSANNTFGPTTLWFDNGTGLGPDYQFGAVAGTSPTLWYRDPFVVDLQRPACDATAPADCSMTVDALSSGPLNDKQVRVVASRHTERGFLVVTSTFAQGYTVSDVQCAGVDAMMNPIAPCTTPAHPNGIVGYDHAMVFTFSAPRDQFGRPIVVGEVIQSFNGGLSEFNGLTELGFPRTFISAPDATVAPFVDPNLMPVPIPFDTTWFAAPNNNANPLLQGRINFERAEAGAIRILGATVCPVDDGPDGVYTSFKQWTIDPDPAGMCRAGSSADRAKLINLITAGTDFTTDPHTLVAKKVDVTGIVRPVSIGTFNVWIVYPRGKDDLTIH